jgi:hypothetical protein
LTRRFSTWRPPCLTQHTSSTPAARLPRAFALGGTALTNFANNVILQLPFGRWVYTDDPDAVLDFEFTQLDFDNLALLRDAAMPA